MFLAPWVNWHKVTMYGVFRVKSTNFSIKSYAQIAKSWQHRNEQKRESARLSRPITFYEARHGVEGPEGAQREQQLTSPALGFWRTVDHTFVETSQTRNSRSPLARCGESGQTNGESRRAGISEDYF